MFSQVLLNIVIGGGILAGILIASMLLVWVFEFIQDNDAIRNILFLILTAAFILGLCYVIGMGVRSA